MFIFNLAGPQFLTLYVVAMVSAWWFSRRIKQGLLKDQPTSQPSIYELAYLAGGADRALSTALARLAHHGHVLQGPHTIQVTSARPLPPSTLPLERGLFRQIESEQPARLTTGRHTALPLQQIASSLAQGGWLVNPLAPNTLRVNRLAALPLLVLMAVGLVKIGVGLMSDKPVFLLVLAVLFTGVLFWGARQSIAQPVTYVESHLRHQRAQNEALHTTVSRNSQHLSLDDLSLAVALFGTTVLASTALSWVQSNSNNPAGGSSSDSGTTGGGGDSSCGGGGGCGGCGGG